MRVDFAFLCDTVDHRGGKLNATGIGLDVVNAEDLFTHPPFYFVARLTATAAELGSKEVAVKLLDQDAKSSQSGAHYSTSNARNGACSFPKTWPPVFGTWPFPMGPLLGSSRRRRTRVPLGLV